jgi:GNAT superfamily N-acetyltransferase
MSIRALKASELDEHTELVFRSYSHNRELAPGSMLTYPDWWRRCIATDPGYEPERTRVLVQDRRLVSSVTCFPRPSYIAGRVAPSVCIGSVCTHPEYRQRGLVRHVLAEAIEWMKNRGVVWSFLYGLEGVYGSSGWRNLSTWTVSADLRVREQSGRDLIERQAEPGADLQTLVDLHASFSRTQTGPTHRCAAYWQRRVLASAGPWEPAPVYYLLERDGRAVGYYAGADGRAREFGWSDNGHDVLAFLLRRWPGKPLSLPCFSTDLVAQLRLVSAIPTKAECRERPGGITLAEAYRGLWQYHQDRERLFPEVSDTPSLLRFLRDHDYLMWPADMS